MKTFKTTFMYMYINTLVLDAAIASIGWTGSKAYKVS